MMSSKMDVPESVVLNDGNLMPVIALGTSRIEIDEASDLIKTAVDLGYRHIDTAQLYHNRIKVIDGLHDIISSGKVKRKDLFITTKLAPYYEKPGDLEDGLRRHLSELKLDYVDACLIHFPVSLKLKFEKYLETNTYPSDMSDFVNFTTTCNHIDQWQELENLKEKGLTKSIGLSNFNQQQIQNILENCKIPPSILQVECHMYLQEDELVRFCNKRQIFLTCFAALGSPGIHNFSYMKGSETFDSILNDPVVKSIADTHGKPVSQLFDFSLSSIELEELSKLDKSQRIFKFEFLKSPNTDHLYPFPDA